MSSEFADRRAPAGSSVPQGSPQPTGRWCGLNPWALVGFAVWMLLMGYLRSLESQMPTDWLKLGLPLLAPYYRPIVDWKDSEREVLRQGLLVDGLNLLLYPLVLWSMLMWVTRCRRRSGQCCARCFHQGARLALLAMPFDLLENLCLYRMALPGAEVTGGSLRLLTAVSLLKLACAFVAGCWLLVGLPLALRECVWPTPPTVPPGDDPAGGRATSPGSLGATGGVPT